MAAKIRAPNLDGIDPADQVAAIDPAKMGAFLRVSKETVQERESQCGCSEYRASNNPPKRRRAIRGRKA